MRTKREVYLYCVLALCFFVLFGCGKKADESKPISEVKAEAEKMDAGQLRSMAMQYKDAIMAKQGDVEEITAKLKEIKVTEMLGDEAKGLKSEIDTLSKSLSALNDRFQVYYDKLKEKDGDLSDLEM